MGPGGILNLKGDYTDNVGAEELDGEASGGSYGKGELG